MWVLGTFWHSCRGVRHKLDLVSAGKNYVRICKAITSSFFFHAARKDPQEVRGRAGMTHGWQHSQHS